MLHGHIRNSEFSDASKYGMEYYLFVGQLPHSVSRSRCLTAGQLVAVLEGEGEQYPLVEDTFPTSLEAQLSLAALASCCLTPAALTRSQLNVTQLRSSY